MNVWRKLGTLMRASAQEPAARLVDANGVRIFEQELRDAEQAIGRSRRELAALMAEKARLARDNDALAEGLQRREQQAHEALDRQAEDLALELAGRIAEDEALLARQRQQHDALHRQETRLRRELRDSARALQRFHGELRLARANQSADRAAGLLRGQARGLRSHLSALDESVATLQRQHAHAGDLEDALHALDQEPGDHNLDDRLEAAGIDTGQLNARKVLDRLKASQAAAS